MALAAPTREAALLLWAAFVASAVLRKQWREARLLAWACIPAAAWNAWVVFAVPAGGVAGERQDFGPPFAGIAQALLAMARGGASLKSGFELYSFALLVACFGFLLAEAFRSWRSGLTAHLCGLVYLGLFVFSSRHLLGYYVDFNRVFMDAWLLLVFGLAAGRRVAARALLLLSGLGAAAFVAAYGGGMI